MSVVVAIASVFLARIVHCRLRMTTEETIVKMLETQIKVTITILIHLEHMRLPSITMQSRRGVRLIYRLHKYDHITEYYNRLRWLKFPQLIHFNSVCSVFHQYQHHSSRGIPLLPPIQFGNQTCYNTRTAPYFANPVQC